MPTYFDSEELKAYLAAYTAYLQRVFDTRPSGNFKVLRLSSGVVWEIKDVYFAKNLSYYSFSGEPLEQRFKIKSCSSKKTKTVSFESLIYEFQLVEVPPAFATLYGPPPTLSRERRNGQ
jgi:hypothetical protein